MSETEDQLYGLMAIAEEQQAAARAAIAGLKAERAALARERESIRQAVQFAVADSLAGAADQGVAAVRAATKPLVAEIAGLTEEATRAEAALRRIVSSFGVRMIGWIVGLIVALVVLGWLATNALVWWDTRTIENLQSQILDMQATRDALSKTGLLGALNYCGPQNRPCIEVDENAGTFGSSGDFRVIKGY